MEGEGRGGGKLDQGNWSHRLLPFSSAKGRHGHDRQERGPGREREATMRTTCEGSL